MMHQLDVLSYVIIAHELKLVRHLHNSEPVKINFLVHTATFSANFTIAYLVNFYCHFTFQWVFKDMIVLNGYLGSVVFYSSVSKC
jgi:hypothetical protein